MDEAQRQALRDRVHGTAVTAATAAPKTSVKTSSSGSSTAPKSNVKWQEDLHPRGVNGQFISADSTVNVYNHLNNANSSSRKYTAQVVSITKKGMRVRYVDAKGHPVKSPGREFPTFIPASQVKNRVERVSDTAVHIGPTQTNNIGSNGLVARPQGNMGNGKVTNQPNIATDAATFNRQHEQAQRLAQIKAEIARRKALNAKAQRHAEALRKKAARKALRDAKKKAKKGKKKAGADPAPTWGPYNPKAYNTTPYF